ncbi:hypothetical protein Cgig2_024432 [Carnegiea gigantea]|uniref:Cytochrome c oxidase assembly factor 3 mitochondrial coiled-coil domain-containing protein n=1 Tax=Carnegiea gigantea TaxID=171969 RepID=A0A9Q1KIX2_9CARY|nr:hypothetical protein Cgig2_024432 [Carnegiea gigantea]
MELIWIESHERLVVACIWSVDVLEVLMFSGLPGIYGAAHLIRWDMDLWVVVVDDPELCSDPFSARVNQEAPYACQGSNKRRPHRREITCRMAGISRFSTLAPKTRNLIVAGGLTTFVFGVYFYTMRAVGGTDELQVAIDKFEEQKRKDEAKAS